MDREPGIQVATGDALVGGRALAVAAVAQALATGVDPRAVVLVEGLSDRAALEALAERRGRHLHAEGVSIISIGGATSVGHFLDLLGPRGLDLTLAGLCDAAEEGDYRRALRRAGLGSDLDRAAMELLGFHVCVEDLEDELIRSLGAASVLQVVQAAGELVSFRTFQQQPAQRGRAIEAQLRRFMGTRSGRKIRYGRLLVEALELARVPGPLDRVLAHV